MNDVVARFHELHRSGCFVIPNPWDAGSARLLESLGFKALATTSSGFAWTMGRRDHGVTLDEVLAHLRALSAAVRIPVSADFEGGFAVAPEEVARNVAAAARTGIAGLSIEDSTSDSENPLFDFELAVERIRAARRAIDASGSGVLLTARSEGFVVGRPDLDETIRRLRAYADAGADCLYGIGVRDPAALSAIVQAVAPKPVNVYVGSDFTSVAELEALGVRRISVGGALARAAWSGFVRAATEIAEKGTFHAFAEAMSGTEINGLFPA
ncbi:MAG TPA: isocitrate lyase/phosphoenolpyruvate mutase family protein [Thermoanaerobaculia bacterium]|jgi:methylisocitrate lyase